MLLTPKNILTKDDTWINRKDMTNQFKYVVASISDNELRSTLNNYFEECLSENSPKTDYNTAIEQTINSFPEYIDYYIKYKEDKGNQASSISSEKFEEI